MEFINNIEDPVATHQAFIQIDEGYSQHTIMTVHRHLPIFDTGAKMPSIHGL